MQTSVLIMTLLSSMGFVAGGLLLKRFSESGASGDLIASLSVYFISNVIFARVLVHGLGQGMVISSMVQMVLMVGAGALLYGERFGERQMLGLALALAVIWLFSKSSGSPT